jgi:hypothetical protein
MWLFETSLDIFAAGLLDPHDMGTHLWTVSAPLFIASVQPLLVS